MDISGPTVEVPKPTSFVDGQVSREIIHAERPTCMSCKNGASSRPKGLENNETEAEDTHFCPRLSVDGRCRIDILAKKTKCSNYGFIECSKQMLAGSFAVKLRGELER